MKYVLEITVKLFNEERQKWFKLFFEQPGVEIEDSWSPEVQGECNKELVAKAERIVREGFWPKGVEGGKLYGPAAIESVEIICQDRV